MSSLSLPPPFELLATFEPFLLVVWTIFFGASVGSFLNVVLYRVPRGMSLIHPGSHCPACGKPIRWYHNLPVFGWLILRGRCRDCEVAISSRYPIIEAITSVLFLSLAWEGPLQHIAAQSALPQVANNWSAFADCALMGYHLIMLCTVLCLAMIDRDCDTENGLRFPVGLLIGVTVAGFAIPVAWQLFATDALSTNVGQHAARAFLGTSKNVAGGVTAILCAAVTWPAMAVGRTGRATRGYAASSLWLVGLFLGPRPVAEIAAATAVLHCLLNCLGRTGGRITWPLVLFAVSWIWIAFRLPDLIQTTWPVPWQYTVVGTLGLVLITALVSVFCWRVGRKFTRH